MKAEKNFTQEKMINSAQFCNFKELYGKLAFPFEAGDFLNIL